MFLEFFHLTSLSTRWDLELDLRQHQVVLDVDQYITFNEIAMIRFFVSRHDRLKVSNNKADMMGTCRL